MHGHDFSNFLKSIHSESLPVLGASISKSKYVPIDLSESNQELNDIDVSLSSHFYDYVNYHIEKHDALVAHGGYLEVRNIYKRSTYFNSLSSQERNIHLGVDLWCEAETPVYTPLDATVHSFKNNKNYGDYGPTIILKHEMADVVFYTLYGHLSLPSIQNLEVGKAFKQGQKIATLGDSSINGDYPAHLHFQIIRALQNFNGDYPGVCNENNLKFYTENCPDPNLLLKL